MSVTKCGRLKSYHWGGHLPKPLLLQGVNITKTEPFGTVYLALGRDPISGEFWSIVSDQPTTLQTFAEYSERFNIEENFQGRKSNGFQLERSWIRSTTAIVSPPASEARWQRFT